MSSLKDVYQFILELNKLKLVFRNTETMPGRRESTAEHSWSVSMIVILLMEQLKTEFPAINELKAIKLSLIHDIVEIYAGDVLAFDIEARKNKEQLEIDALNQLMKLNPAFGQQLHDLWYEFEDSTTLEAQIAKAADAICPIFLRYQAKQSYIPINITIADMEKIKRPRFGFSKTFNELYEQLKSDLLNESLIVGNNCAS